MRKAKIIVLVLLLTAILSGCNNPMPDSGKTSEKESSQIRPIDSGYTGEEISESEMKEIHDECKKAASLYKDIYEDAEKTPSSDWPNRTVISQEDRDSIEMVLKKAGYSVINSDSVYPEYLENPDGVSSFWEDVQKNKDAETVFWEVSLTGSVYYRALRYSAGDASYIFVSTVWDEQGNLEISDGGKWEVLNWDTTFNGDFYFQNKPTKKVWDATQLLRLKPVDKELYDLNAKYILPVGYHNVNLFLCDWDTSDYGDLCFNDLFE